MSVSLETVEAELKKRNQQKLTIGVAVDGSVMSDRAANVAGNFVNIKRGDKLIQFHISDCKKDYLPRNLQPAHLKNYYNDLAARTKVGLIADWICREKEEGKTTCESLAGLASKQGLDLLVLGSFGRKGEKLDILGSVADNSLRQANTSMCIVRSTGNKFDKAAKFIFSTDGSHAAAVAFVWLVDYLARPTDKIHVIMISTTDGTQEEKYLEQYRSYMQAKKIAGEVTVRCIDRLTSTVPDGILEATRELDGDVLVVGISGFGNKKLGSVSEEISIRAHCTTLVVKDPLEVVSNRYSKGGAGTLAREFLPNGSFGSKSGKLGSIN